jgi:hypothetical protein
MRHSQVQRVGDRVTGGEMADAENVWNGPGSCLPKETVGQTGRRR